MLKTQKDVLDWSVATFGECAKDRKERARRLIEEAIELAQAEGLPCDDAVVILRRVYERPKGETVQEIAGVAVTLMGLAENIGVELDFAVKQELARIDSLGSQYFRLKHIEKVADGVALPMVGVT